MKAQFLKKLAFAGVLSALCVGNLSAASNNNYFQQYKSYESSLLSNFGNGRVIKASTKANSATWVFYNEGHLGYSYSKLGSTILNSADIGYSSYIMAIRSAQGLHPYVGLEITVPIYLQARGDSNIFANPSSMLPNGRAVLGETGFTGWGVQVPVVIGVQAGSFYIQAMGGYAYHAITDTFYKSEVENNWSADTAYQGIIYGGGVGWRLNNTFSMGVRYIMGNLTNTTRTPTSENFNALNSDIKTKDFQVPYYRASVIFGYVF
ncbi:hypothetical protein CQA49_00695 [Helicobacter sp. MIT 00-7814]|uniref:hypothetical protein n=1 Tax=unclassified Helicobacter TaxID=2593540 RepID=UPI000E1E4ED3|nr:MULTISPECIES: hypothetical protein [unclassified Helicobacter]RDU57212.1 hypothetical protein CQA49_00695 [Helicobacter sp. MIT 00-7814]RDU57764.1 hypothetical protein CQA37_00695 [Helicobacter sp. MIT 99-10781]